MVSFSKSSDLTLYMVLGFKCDRIILTLQITLIQEPFFPFIHKTSPKEGLGELYSALGRT
jgi:hypothetical protein